MVAGNSGKHFHIESKMLQELEERKTEDESRAEERWMKVQRQREVLRSSAGSLPNVSDLRIVLLGYRGSGKGSSGNTILGRPEFITSSRTAPCVKRQGRAAGRKVTLVEAVGWVLYHSVENTPARDQQELIGSLSLFPPGPHALLLVISISLTFNEEHRRALQEHLELLGEGVWGHTLVLFTRGDWLGDTTLEQHIESGGEALKWVVEKCGNRYHILNNLNRQDRDQVSDLLDKVVEMVAGNNNLPFSAERSMDCGSMDCGSMDCVQPKLREQLVSSPNTRADGTKVPEPKDGAKVPEPKDGAKAPEPKDETKEPEPKDGTKVPEPKEVPESEEELTIKVTQEHSRYTTDQIDKALQKKISFVDPSKITVCSESQIGSGAFEKVYMGQYQGTPAAVKIMEVEDGPMTECFVPM
ncbi:GTPase IMAP family member 9-like [Alosa pseudoharengus]|uniref:GTPase IMAP family member 9-like n=1 Tax=Alosa pseudoharengus TaxID=34774 RepID=UPI003F8B4DF8